MNGPDPPAQRVFFSEVHAAEHLCDHALTRPEAHDWAVVLPGYDSLVSPREDTELRRVGASLFPGPSCAEAQTLLELYVAAILQNIEDALRLGFWWEQHQGKYQEWLGLGLDGIYVIWDRKVIKSGYFPGSASFPPTGEIRPRTENPLPRRDPARQLRPPPPPSPRRPYELFRTSHYCISKLYAGAYENGEVEQAGGDVFVDPINSPRFGKWQRWLSERPDEPPSS